MQHSILDIYPDTFFATYRTAIFHVVSGANVHATNNKKDFVIFHPIRSSINLAAGSTALCEGIGDVIIQLSCIMSPILIAPVYFCPTAKISTILPSAPKYYNLYTSVIITANESVIFQRTMMELVKPMKMVVQINWFTSTYPLFIFLIKLLLNRQWLHYFNKRSTNSTFIKNLIIGILI